MTNYYHVLGLSESATPQEIKAAFKKLAVKYHPDKHPGVAGMEEKFKEVNRAHQVLSDEYEKARFDLKLKYQQFSSTHQHQPPPYSYQQRSSQRRRPQYAPPKVDYRQNAIATFYAFGITFLIALIVMTGVWIKQTYDQHQLEELLAERRSNYMEAKTSFNSGQYKKAIDIMSSLAYFRRSEEDMKSFKEDMIDNIIVKADQSFISNDFPEAIKLYNMVVEFEPGMPFFEMKGYLAEAYRLNNQPKKAITVLEEFLVNDYEIMETLVKIAEINRDMLDDFETAKDYYMIGHRVAVKRYKKFYGKGYAMVINEEFVPKSHYALYSGLADLYFQMNDFEMAIKAASWNKYVWPDSIDAYVTSAESYLAMNQQFNACFEYKEALDIGWEGIPKINCN
ncbi:MAG: DnaJ domain-containing protein [Ekhidna sp.]